MWLYQVDTGYACAGIVLYDAGVCIEAAPIFTWMIGQHFYDIYYWKKIHTLRRVDGAKNTSSSN